MKSVNFGTNKVIGLATLSFFLCLFAWSFNVPISAAPDSDHHMASIWCAWGEKPGICQGKEIGSAEVPYFVQICEGVPLPSRPTCEADTDPPSMQRLRMTNSEGNNLYYVLMRAFASHNVTSSIITIRLFSSLLATILLLGTLILARSRLLIGAICMFTFVNLTNVFYHFTMATPKSWALMGAMFSWIFLEVALNATKNRSTRFAAWALYGLSIFLVVATRIDATLFALFSNFVVVASKFNFDVLRKSWKKASLVIGCGIVIAMMALRVPRIQGYLNGFTPQTNKSVVEYVLFILSQATETLASCFSYSFGQSGSSPVMSGIIGLSLFALVMGVSLQNSNRLQLTNLLLITGLFVAAIFRGNTLMGPRVPGTYVLSIAAMLIGFTVTRANQGPQFMFIRTGRIAVITLLFLSQFSTGHGSGKMFWGISINPIFTHWLSMISFLAFLLLAWKSIDKKLQEENRPTKKLALGLNSI
jgi:hypothetical protein